MFITNKELNARINKAFLQGKNVGLREAKKQELNEKFSPNDIRRLFGLPDIKTETIMGNYCQFCIKRTVWGTCYDDCCVGGNRFEAAVSPDKFAEEMIRIKNRFEDDVEFVHVAMDKAMIDLLDKLGYSHGTKVFKDTPNKRWA